jgi:large subunit ribosomal protein L9
VTTYDIAEALSAQGHEVERAAIRLPQGPLKSIGDHQVEIALHADAHATVTVSVLGEVVE